MPVFASVEPSVVSFVSSLHTDQQKYTSTAGVSTLNVERTNSSSAPYCLDTMSTPLCSSIGYSVGSYGRLA